MERNSMEDTLIDRYWWVSVIALIALISGLWFCIKSCRQDELGGRIYNEIGSVETGMDSILFLKSEHEAKSV